VKIGRRLLLIGSAAALAWAVLVAATGGIHWRIAGVVLSSRESSRALAIGVVLFLAHAIVFREAFSRDTGRAVHFVRRLGPGLALCGALMLGAHAIHYGAFTAGGADSFAYVNQAYGWAGGALPRPEPLPISVPWPSGDSSLAPLGYRAGPQPHTMVPSYAPGLPLMMAAALGLGACGPFLVVPLCAALAVWLTFLLGRRTGGPWAGILAALLVMTSPIVLFQSVWAMSDVPAAAAWTGAALAALGTSRRSAVATGIWAAAGLLIRPNLPILPLVFLAHLAVSSRGRERWVRVALFSAPVAPAAIAIAALNTAWYGAPWNSGYGAAREIYSLAAILPNLARYPVWLWKSQSPLVLLALVPFLPRFRREVSKPAVRLCAALFLATLFSYLVYSTFEEWWYLRFLLPAIPAFLVLMACGIVTLARRIPRPWGPLAATVVASLLVAFTLNFSVAQGTFGRVKTGERRYADIGTYVHEALPPNAVVLTVQHSGSVRYYGGRMTIRWDLIDREWTERAAAEVERLGLHPYMVIEDWEMPQMRGWFGLASDAPAPWPLVARMREPVGVSVLDMSSQPVAGTIPAALEPGGTPLCGVHQPLTIQRK
jgi:hypothetical protein